MKRYKKTAVSAVMDVSDKWPLNEHYFLSNNDPNCQTLYLWQFMAFKVKANEPFVRQVMFEWFKQMICKEVFQTKTLFSNTLEKFGKISIQYLNTCESLPSIDP